MRQKAGREIEPLSSHSTSVIVVDPSICERRELDYLNLKERSGARQLLCFQKNCGGGIKAGCAIRLTWLPPSTWHVVDEVMIESTTMKPYLRKTITSPASASRNLWLELAFGSCPGVAGPDVERDMLSDPQRCDGLTASCREAWLIERQRGTVLRK